MSDKSDLKAKTYLTKSEVCDYLKIKKTSADKLFRRPDFPKVQIGGSSSVEIHDLEEFLKTFAGQKIKV